VKKKRKKSQRQGGNIILHTANRRKGKLICHSLCRNCLLKHVIVGNMEGRINVTGGRGRRRKQLLDNFKKKKRHWQLKGGALDDTVRRTRVGRGYGPVGRETAY